MHFMEMTEGEFQVFIGALESPIGDGYTAALVLQRRHGMSPRDAFRDDSLACGHRWASADDAMSYALRKAREMIRSKPEALLC